MQVEFSTVWHAGGGGAPEFAFRVLCQLTRQPSPCLLLLDINLVGIMLGPTRGFRGGRLGVQPAELGAGSRVPQEVLAHVTYMVEDGCRVCRRVQAEGIQVLSLITREPHSMTEVATAQEREKWAAAVRVSV